MPPLKIWSPPARQWGPWYKLAQCSEGILRLVVEVKSSTGFSEGFDLELSYWNGQEMAVDFFTGPGAHEVFLEGSSFFAKIRLRNHTAGSVLTVCGNSQALPCFLKPVAVESD